MRYFISYACLFTLAPRNEEKTIFGNIIRDDFEPDRNGIDEMERILKTNYLSNLENPYRNYVVNVRFTILNWIPIKEGN